MQSDVTQWGPYRCPSRSPNRTGGVEDGGQTTIDTNTHDRRHEYQSDDLHGSPAGIRTPQRIVKCAGGLMYWWPAGFVCWWGLRVVAGGGGGALSRGAWWWCNAEGESEDAGWVSCVWAAAAGCSLCVGRCECVAQCHNVGGRILAGSYACHAGGLSYVPDGWRRWSEPSYVVVCGAPRAATLFGHVPATAAFTEGQRGCGRRRHNHKCPRHQHPEPLRITPRLYGESPPTLERHIVESHVSVGRWIVGLLGWCASGVWWGGSWLGHNHVHHCCLRALCFRFQSSRSVVV